MGAEIRVPSVASVADCSGEVDDLRTLNQIVEALNQAVDVRGALQSALGRLVKLMELETGWIFVRDPAAGDRREGEGFALTAHYNLPPGLSLEREQVWEGGCKCQRLAAGGDLQAGYNEVRCSRLVRAAGDRRGLAVHASVPLRSGDRVLGILNVAGPDWAAFSTRALALLTNAGNQMGVALERARLFDLLKERRTEEQAALLDVSNQLLRRLDLDDVMSYVVQEARRLLRADACALLLPGETPDTLVFGAATGWRADPVANGYPVPDAPGAGPSGVMRTQKPLLVEDIAASDGATCRAEWLRSEGFRGHAVVPLVVDGHSIGVLMLDARQPRLLDQDEVRFLRLMANQASIAIETARLHGEELERQRLEQELSVSRQVQLDLLPQECPDVPGWQFAAGYHAARQLGGDFYDFFDLPIDPGRLGVVIADVVDKGVPAALFMALSRAVMRSAALDHRCPSDTLAQANALILSDGRGGQFVTAFYAALDTGTGRLTYVNAGHNRPLWVKAGSGEIQELAARGIALGVVEEVELEERELDLAPGDLLVLYTDGVTEAMDTQGQPFGQARLEEVLAANREGSAEQILAAVEEAVQAFAGKAPQSDDLTLLVVKRESS
jgi:sigma-B regulation protein RsbU (phosphoserine phosphatase)